MSIYSTYRKKIRHAARLDRAVRFVWQAGPGWMICSSVIVLLQGTLPLLSLYLMKLIVDSVTASITAYDSAEALHQVFIYIAMAGGVAIIQLFVQALSSVVQERMSLTVSDQMYDILVLIIYS